MKTLIIFLFLSSCAFFEKKSGGEHLYRYDAKKDYSAQELSSLTEDMVVKTVREPMIGGMDLLQDKKFPIKKLGIIVFESEVQPTRGGLSDKNKVYLSSAGKQIVTENFLKIWEEKFGESLTVSTKTLSENSSYQSYGSAQEDFSHFKQSVLFEEDIFLLESGKKTSSDTVISPRWMRDYSLVYIPAYDLLKGPKWNEHQRHMIQEVCRDLDLDAVLVIKSDLDWKVEATDKRSGEHTSDLLKVKIGASVLIPYGKFHERLNSRGISEKPLVNTVFANYEIDYSTPISLSSDFVSIEESLLKPMMKIYGDLAQILMIKIKSDLK